MTFADPRHLGQMRHPATSAIALLRRRAAALDSNVRPQSMTPALRGSKPTQPDLISPAAPGQTPIVTQRDAPTFDAFNIRLTAWFR